MEKVLPYPSIGLNLQRQQFVDSGRNGLGSVVAQKVNRRMNKLSGLTWKHLTADEWRSIQVEIDKLREC